MPESLLQSPPKCPNCDGQRRVIQKYPSTFYACGYEHKAATCPECRGTGVAKKPVGRVRRLLSMLGVRA